MPGLESNSNTDSKPCRTCTDFKSWTKIQTTKFNRNAAGEEATGHGDKSVKPSTTTDSHQTSDRRPDCPYDKDDLGRSTWGLLHTMAANYPDVPSKEEISNMTTFFSIFANVYPCDICAKDFRKELASEPIQASSQHSLSQWLCRMHNKVNSKLGKPVFDCGLVNQRWRDGWNDGSCD